MMNDNWFLQERQKRYAQLSGIDKATLVMVSPLLLCVYMCVYQIQCTCLYCVYEWMFLSHRNSNGGLVSHTIALFFFFLLHREINNK